MENIINCELCNENSGIYISFDESISSGIFNQIAEALSANLIIDEISSYCVFISCDEPSWSDIADAREDINNVVTELGYKLKWQ